MLREQPAVRDDLARIAQIWTELLAAHGGPLLFGRFGIADAFFAPVVMRVATYALPFPGTLGDYVAAVKALPAVQAWVKDSLAEKDFVPFDEPYRKPNL